MKSSICSAVIIAFVLASALDAPAETMRGTVVDQSGKAVAGVMVSAFDGDRRQSTSVFSQADGSFTIDGLREADYRVRARLMGQRDKWIEGIFNGTHGSYWDKPWNPRPDSSWKRNDRPPAPSTG